MKYCVNYQKGVNYLTDVDEITINFRRKDTTLIDFLQKYKNQTINIHVNVQDEEDFIKHNCIDLFKSIKEQYPELKFVFKIWKGYSIPSILYPLREANLPFYFENLVRDWDTLYGIAELEPSSIYIVEQLGFEILQVAEFLHSRGIEVRCFPNIGQSSWGATPALKKFFIRPEDIPTYEPYIDICEFFTGAVDNIATYLKIYTKDKQWFGKLNELIMDFDSDIDSRFLLKSFAERRLSCGKRCLKGRPCRVCEASEQLAEVLEENKILVKEKD